MIEGQKIGYIRVSSVDQNEARQLDGVELDKKFIDKCSGKDTDRPELINLFEFVRSGDTVLVHDISRMARNVKDLIELIERLQNKGVSIRFIKEGLQFDNNKANPMNDLILTILGAIYQFERSMILERQKEGIAIAKAEGKYKGKQSLVDLKQVQALLDNKMCISAIAKEMEISRASVYRAIDRIGA